MDSSGFDLEKIEAIVGEFLLDSKHFGCLVVDEHGTVILANNTFFSIFPVLDKHLIGKHLSLATHPKEEAKVREAISYLFDHGELAQKEWRLLSLSNTDVYVDIEASLFEVDERQYAVGIFINRTNKNTLENTLEEQTKSVRDINTKYRLAINTAKLGLWEYGVIDQSYKCNKELLDIYELTQTEWDTDSLAWFKLIVKEYQHVAQFGYKKALEGETLYNLQFKIVTKSGKKKHITTSVAPVYGQDGKVIEIHGISQDITEVVNTQNILNEREKLLSNINNQFPGFVLRNVRDSLGNEHLSYISEGVKEVYGIDAKTAKENISLIWDRIDKKDYPKIQQLIDESRNNLKAWSKEFVAYHVSGEKKFLRGYATPHLDDNGNLIADTLILDITKEKENDLAILESQQILEKLTDQVPGVVSIYQLLPDGTDRYTFLSKGVEKLYGVNREQALEDVRLLWEKIHPEDVAEITEKTKLSAENLTPWNHIFRITNNDGSVKYIQGSGSPVKLDDGTIEWYSINLDITEQVIQQEKISENKKHLNLISDNFPGVIYTFVRHKDGTENISYISKGIKTIHGISIEDALNDTNLIWNLIHPEDLQAFKDSVLESAETLSPMELQFRCKVKDGSYRYFQSYGMPTKLSTGSIIWSSISFDVHVQVVSQNQIIKQKEQLESITDQINGVVLKYQVLPDGTDRVTYISKRVDDYWGVSAEAVIEDVSKGWARIVPEDVEAARNSVLRSVQNLTKWEPLIRFISKTGEVKYMQGLGTPKTLPSGIIEFDIVMIDVTDMQRARKDIETKQQQLETIGAQIPGVVFTYARKPDGTDAFLYLSEGFEEIYGVNKEVALANPQNVWDHIHPDDKPSLINTILNSAQALTNFNVQFRVIHSNGEAKYLQGFGAPTKSDDGSIVWNCVNLDITDRRLAEIEIEEKQKQLESITNQIPGLVVRYKIFPNGSDKILYISNGVEELYGISQEDAYADTSKIFDRILPEDFNSIKQSIQISTQTLTNWEHVFRYRAVDDSIGYLHGFGTPHKQEDGSIIWDTIIMDSTQRVKAELEAVKSSEKLRSLINASPLAIYQLNADGIVTDFWNPAAENIFGWLRKEVIGIKLPQIDKKTEEEIASILDSIKKERVPKQYLVTRKNKYLEELTLEITAGPSFNDDGELTDLLVIANDVTELQEYKKTLEAALKEKDILLQEIHHRVKNNLAIVSGLLELQAMRNDTNKDMSMIIEARNRIHSIAMVHEQLYQDMDFSHINPREYYRKLLQKLQANTITDSRDIEYDLIFDIDKININRAVPLGLLINELFTNSIKYAFADGNGKLTLHFKQQGDQITIYYEDNGPGFVIDDIRPKNTIGWQLIETLLEQLDSKYTLDTEGRFMLEFEFTETLQGSQGHF